MDVRIITKKRAAAAVAALAIAGGGMAAYAYWTAGGTGTGSAPTGTTVALTVNQTATASNLYPGASVALSGTFNNPNPGSVTVTSVTAVVDSSFNSRTDTNKPACTSADFSISGTATIGNAGVVPSGNGTGSWSGLTVSMTNTALNQDNCKSVSVPIIYTAS
jgi:hypothetical protein